MTHSTRLSDPNKHVYVLRVWRVDVESNWRYTVVTTDVDSKHYFQTLAEMIAFISPHVPIDAPTSTCLSP